MIYKTEYKTPIGSVILVAENNSLIGLWLEGQKYYLSNITESLIEKDDYPIFNKTKKWLDRYFNSEKPSISELNITLIGSAFRKNIWQILLTIQYGTTITYNDIAKKIAKSRNIPTMSAQAIGQAVGHNPISIIIPCHRVVGSNGSLTGYAAGITKKLYLLKHENIDTSKFFIPSKKEEHYAKNIK